MIETNKERRKWLALGGIVLGGSLLPKTLLASTSTPKPRILSFHNINTGERLTAPIDNGGIRNSAVLNKLNYFLRDRRTQLVHSMDPKLFTKFYRLQSNLGLRNIEIKIICGYRAPQTNAAMHRRSHSVAKNSYHIQGRAIDFRIDAVSLAKLRQAAIKLNSGGVGYYPRSNFVHVDTGPVRTWRG